MKFTEKEELIDIRQTFEILKNNKVASFGVRSKHFDTFFLWNYSSKIDLGNWEKEINVESSIGDYFVLKVSTFKDIKLNESNRSISITTTVGIEYYIELT